MCNYDEPKKEHVTLRAGKKKQLNSNNTDQMRDIIPFS